MQLVLEASGGSIKGSLVGRANVNWNVRYANLAGSLDAVPPSCHHQPLALDYLGFEPVVDTGWREQVMVGVTDRTSLRIAASAHPLEVLGARASADPVVDGGHLRHVGTHLLRRSLRGRRDLFVLSELPGRDSHKPRAPRHPYTSFLRTRLL